MIIWQKRYVRTHYRDVNPVAVKLKEAVTKRRSLQEKQVCQ
jgi:hypothetical protein